MSLSAQPEIHEKSPVPTFPFAASLIDPEAGKRKSAFVFLYYTFPRLLKLADMQSPGRLVC